MTKTILIGAVAKPQGIKGELKIRLFADDFKSVSGVTAVFMDGEKYAVERLRKISDEEAILKLSGVDDRNAAEVLRRKELFADRSEIVVPEGKHFIADLIGCEFFLTSGKKIGEVTDIVKGNVDYYYLDTVEGKAVFPKVDGLIAEVDLENRRITADAKKFTEVVMYED